MEYFGKLENLSTLPPVPNPLREPGNSNIGLITIQPPPSEAPVKLNVANISASMAHTGTPDETAGKFIVADNRAFHVEETAIAPSAPIPVAQVQQVQVHSHLSAQAQSQMQGAASVPQAMTGSRVPQPVLVEQTTYEHRGDGSSVANGSKSVPIFSGAIAAGGSGQLGGTLTTPPTAAPRRSHGANVNAQPSTTGTSLLMARNTRIYDDDDTVPLG